MYGQMWKKNGTDRNGKKNTILEPENHQYIKQQNIHSYN